MNEARKFLENKFIKSPPNTPPPAAGMKAVLDLINPADGRVNNRDTAPRAVRLFIFYFLAAVLLLSFLFFWNLRPASSGDPTKIFEISSGEGFLAIANRLNAQKLIRSKTAFKIYSITTGSASRIKPGIYEISGGFSTPEIVGLLTESSGEIEVMILDGASVYDIDILLSRKKVLPAGFLVSFAMKNDTEGKLYPDTYKFSEHSTVKAITDKFLKNFYVKAEPALNQDPANYKKNLILASLVQREVSDENDSRIVAGILKKRLSTGMKLDVDATICYLKKVINGQFNCYPLSPEDFKIESPYNTYLHIGLPPGPIGSPNVSAINAVMNSQPSPYWFYLSDPKTGKTIFAKTLDEQSANRRIYLR